MTLLFQLLIIYQLKYFLADFPLQGRYMLGKFKGDPESILPLAAHASVHWLFTLVICLAIKPAMWPLAFLDFGVHFCVTALRHRPILGDGGKWISHNFGGLLAPTRWRIT